MQSMNNRGHNERAMRLDILADEARQGLKRVEEGEEFTIGGWLAYGHALNEGRALFPGDREFGEWVSLSQLGTAGNGEEIRREDRAAAMWAAANSDQFEEARQRGNPRTIRGIHAKWKEIEAEQERERFEEEQRQRKAEQVEVMNSEQPAAQEQGQPAAPSEVSDRQPDKQEIASKPAALQPDPTDRQPDTAQESDPYGYAKLTDAALLDEANGLREDLEDEKARRKAAEAERDEFKARLVEATSDNQGATISKLQKQVQSLKYTRDEAQAAAKRMEYRLKKAEEERDAALRSLQSQEIAL